MILGSFFPGLPAHLLVAIANPSNQIAKCTFMMLLKYYMDQTLSIAIILRVSLPDG
jgi:hypothetical protein